MQISKEWTQQCGCGDKKGREGQEDKGDISQVRSFLSSTTPLLRYLA